MNHPAPGFEKHPGHTMVITPAGTRVGVTIDGVEIATTDAAQLLAEAGYPAVYYLPLDTLHDDMLVDSDHKSYCPFKGDAGYYHLIHNEKHTKMRSGPIAIPMTKRRR